VEPEAVFAWEIVPTEARGKTCLARAGERLVVGVHGGAIFSDDDGGSFESASLDGEGVGWVRGVGAEDELVCVVGDQGVVLVSTDRAARFRRVDAGVGRQRFEGVAIADDTIWIVGSQGTVVRSADRGVTWTRLDSGVDAHLAGIWRADDGVLYVAGTGGTVLCSRDEGEHWEVLRRKGQALFYGIAGRPDGSLFAPALRSVHVSRDGGTRWTARRTGTNGCFYAGVVATAREVWVAGSEDRRSVLVWSVDGSKWARADIPDCGDQLDGLLAVSDDLIWVCGDQYLLRGRRQP
jgi:photosystem II stability/assembly factor-like uncharacterized protein